MPHVISRLLPRGVTDLLRQIVLFCGAYWLYRLVRGLVYDHSAEAFGHARDIVALERSLHLFVEPSVQAWAIGTGWVDEVASWMYLNTHFVVTTCTLAFIYLFRNEHFYFVRNMFMVAMGLALVGYVIYPCAPPRMLGGLGFVDSVSDFTGVSSDASVNTLFNPYAAVPSMHVGFALMLAVPMIRMARQGWVKAVWFFYPPVVASVVVITANHWIFDAATGAATAGVSAVAAHVLFARARPLAWAWAPAAAREDEGLPASAHAG
jgi:PAP2 superfamily